MHFVSQRRLIGRDYALHCFPSQSGTPAIFRPITIVGAMAFAKVRPIKGALDPDVRIVTVFCREEPKHEPRSSPANMMKVVT